MVPGQQKLLLLFVFKIFHIFPGSYFFDQQIVFVLCLGKLK